MWASACAMSAGKLSPAALASCSASPLIVTVKRPFTRCSVTGFMCGWLAVVEWLGVVLWPLHPVAAAMTDAKQVSSAAAQDEYFFRIRLLLPLVSYRSCC